MPTKRIFPRLLAVYFDPYLSKREEHLEMQSKKGMDSPNDLR
jgi:hypothetical protein